MWAFFDFGLLMPALVPAAVKDRADVLAWTNNGEYELQVRGRLREHLQYFMDTFMEPGTFNDEIHVTPNMDYNVRFYTTREAYAEGIKQAALAMDYEKFKVTSERFTWNKVYHNVLNSIWASLTKLAEPGGFYGPRSAENPDGYDPARRYSSWGGSEEGYYSHRHDLSSRGTLSGRYVGDTFGVADDLPEVNFGSAWWEDDAEEEDFYRAPNGDIFTIDEDTKLVIDELDAAAIPMAEWWSYTTPSEYNRLQMILKHHFGKKLLRSMRKQNLRRHVEKIKEYTESINS